MERPKTKDGACIAYFDYLEKLNEAFKTETKKKFFSGLQRQLDIISDELLAEDFKVSLKNEFIQQGDKWVKVDGGFDNYMTILTKGTAIVQAMGQFLEAAVPKEQNSKGLISSETAENYFRRGEK